MKRYAGVKPPAKQLSFIMDVSKKHGYNFVADEPF
jgi:hypothetical protein